MRSMVRAASMIVALGLIAVGCSKSSERLQTGGAESEAPSSLLGARPEVDWMPPADLAEVNSSASDIVLARVLEAGDPKSLKSRTVPPEDLGELRSVHGSGGARAEG